MLQLQRYRNFPRGCFLLAHPVVMFGRVGTVQYDTCGAHFSSIKASNLMLYTKIAKQLLHNITKLCLACAQYACILTFSTVKILILCLCYALV